ncbi:MAG: amidase family protein, partial [Pseudomonadota bacterium]
ADVKLSLAAMAAPDPRDPWYVPAPLEGRGFPKRVALCVAPDGMSVADEVRAALATAADTLRGAGWTVDEVAIPSMRRAADINACLWMAETQIAAQDLIEREAEPDSQFVFEQMSRLAGEVGLSDLMSALQARAALVRDWEVFLQDYPVVMCPVSGALPFPQQQDVSSPEAFDAIYEAQLVQRGVPTLSVPSLTVATGETDGHPFGVQLIASRYREDILFAAGFDLERTTALPTVAEPDWD